MEAITLQQRNLHWLQIVTKIVTNASRGDSEKQYRRHRRSSSCSRYALTGWSSCAPRDSIDSGTGDSRVGAVCGEGATTGKEAARCLGPGCGVVKAEGKGAAVEDVERGGAEREMCPWAISKYFGDLVSNTSA
jgi:hypothetical protein